MSRTIKTTMPLVVVFALGGATLGSRTFEDAHARAPIIERSLHAAANPARRPAARGWDSSQLPLHFAVNRGQSAPDVTFVSHGPGYGVALRATDAQLTLSPPDGRTADAPASTTVRMTFVDANPSPRISGVEELPGKANYFIGRKARSWRTNVPLYAKVLSRELYPGIDLVYYGHQRQLEYDLIVAPRADPSRIAVRFDGVEPLLLAADGDLVLRTAAGEIRQKKPVIYQMVGSSRRSVEGRYHLRGPHEVGFAIDAYDISRPLVIDPVIAYATYLDLPVGARFAVDAAGHAYVGFSTTTTDFPAAGGRFGSLLLSNAAVMKLSADGGSLLYVTVVGGSGPEIQVDIAADAGGHAYLAGRTGSLDFPVVNAIQTELTGGSTGAEDRDPFVTKLTPAGDALVYSTYLGGPGLELDLHIVPDAAGHAHLALEAVRSGSLPVVNAFQPVFRGTQVDVYLAKLSPGGAPLVYATYLGGNSPPLGDEGLSGLAVDLAGNAYVAGGTPSRNFPVVNPFQPELNGSSDSFLTKFRPDGTVVYSTFLGGSLGGSPVSSVAADPSGQAVLAGFTPIAADFPPGAPGPDLAFVLTLSADGARIVRTAFISGATSTFGATAVASDGAGNVLLAGQTSSPDFPLVDSIQSLLRGPSDAFVTKIAADGSGLIYSTLLGGSGEDGASAIAVDAAGSAYVFGGTSSSDFPVVNALQPALSGESDNFLAKVSAFDVCLQDDRRGHALQVNVTDGGYEFSGCDAGGARRLGMGRVTRVANLVLVHEQGVFVLYNTRFNFGVATIVIPGRGVFTITDRNTIDNTCTCQ